jgi:hypothetical protein
MDNGTPLSVRARALMARELRENGHRVLAIARRSGTDPAALLRVRLAVRPKGLLPGEQGQVG